LVALGAAVRTVVGDDPLDDGAGAAVGMLVTVVTPDEEVTTAVVEDGNSITVAPFAMKLDKTLDASSGERVRVTGAKVVGWLPSVTVTVTVPGSVIVEGNGVDLNLIDEEPVGLGEEKGLDLLGVGEDVDVGMPLPPPTPVSVPPVFPSPPSSQVLSVELPLEDGEG